MKSLYQPRWGMAEAEKILTKRQAEEIIRVRGDNRFPDFPRSVIAQAGSRKAVISWDLPLDSSRVVGYRIYKDKVLLDEIPSPAARIYNVDITAGTYASIFVSAVAASGLESARIQVLANATTEAGAPSDPVQPPAVVEQSPPSTSSSAPVFRQRVGGKTELDY